MNEWLRLRQDFDREASRYHALRMVSYFITRDGIIGGQTTYSKPNHEIMLYQYFGNAVSDLEKPQLTAFGVIIGEQTELFRRMAYRAGSLLPDKLRITLLTAIMEKFLDKNRLGKPIYSLNRNPLATWIIFILATTATIYPNRMEGTTLRVDPFAASLSAIDYILDWKSQYDNRSQTPKSTGRKDNAAGLAIENMKFMVALSFPGEKRKFIEKVALALCGKLGYENVFYDTHFEAELARPDLDLVLQQIYHDQSSLITVFVCKEFNEKEWCGLEWRALRDLIKQRQGHKIMIFRFDNVDVPGLFSIDGYIDLNNRFPQDVATLICKRLVALSSGDLTKALHFIPSMHQSRYSNRPVEPW